MDQHSNAGATGAERDLGDLVVEAFGDEWSRFTNEVLTEDELRAMFEDYARIFPWDELPSAAIGFDAGCGSGRWARFFAPRVGVLHCVDASAAALDVARRNLASHDNVVFHHEPLEHLSLEDASCDFGYSLGVLHHIPDPLAAARACVRKLKPGAPFLVYLYYSLSESGAVTGALFAAVSAGRRLISRLPPRARHAVTDVIAATVYYPLARTARLVERAGRSPSRIPLFQYRHRSFYVMRNDALDRFGTRLEQRYTKAEVRELLEAAGLERIEFSDSTPYWVAVGRRTPATAEDQPQRVNQA